MDQIEIIDRDTARARGATYFRTGRSCIRGHDAPRYVSSGGCTACQNRFGGTDVPVASYSILITDGLRTVELRNRSTRGVYQWRRTASGAFESRNWGMARKDANNDTVPWKACTIEGEPDVLAMLNGAPAPVIGGGAPPQLHYITVRVMPERSADWRAYLQRCVDAFGPGVEIL